MRSLNLVQPGDHVKLLCLGAHPDDIEIGAGGTLLSWIEAGVSLDIQWCIATALGERETEARAAAASFLCGATNVTLNLASFEDGHLPYQANEVKNWVESLKHFDPDIILTHRREDAHQDHRFLNEVAWNTFRSNLILEYEIPKWDGDLGQPNFYVQISEAVLARKVALLERHYCSQKSKAWFDADTFRGMARLRGMECTAADRFAEAFTMRKAIA